MTTATLPSRLLSRLPSLRVRGAVWPHVLGTLVCTGTALLLHALTALRSGQFAAGDGLLPEPLTSLLPPLSRAFASRRSTDSRSSS